MSTPTLINLPPPPSDPVTPSDMGPGTPNSGTTSLSALSTTAIKDGHQGHRHPHSHNHRSSTSSAGSTTTLDAERADRISRLAGLERVATARSGSQYHNQHNSHSQSTNQHPSYSHPPPGYFDNNGNPLPAALLRERSTVGSASATGSNAGRTTSTWVSGGSDDVFDSADKMSEMMDDEGADESSLGGFSDEGNASLVGFGEGAGSTLSGPVSSARGGRVGSPAMGKTSANAVMASVHQSGSPMSGVMRSSPSPAGSNTPEPVTDARMMDGMTYDANVVDTAAGPPRPVEESSEAGNGEIPERKV